MVTYPRKEEEREKKKRIGKPEAEKGGPLTLIFYSKDLQGVSTRGKEESSESKGRPRLFAPGEKAQPSQEGKGEEKPTSPRAGKRQGGLFHSLSSCAKKMTCAFERERKRRREKTSIPKGPLRAKGKKSRLRRGEKAIRPRNDGKVQELQIKTSTE